MEPPPDREARRFVCHLCDAAVEESALREHLARQHPDQEVVKVSDFFRPAAAEDDGEPDTGDDEPGADETPAAVNAPAASADAAAAKRCVAVRDPETDVPLGTILVPPGMPQEQIDATIAKLLPALRRRHEAKARLGAARERLPAAMTEVESVVGSWYPEALAPLKAALALAAINCFAGMPQPVTLVLIALAGAGKTLVLSFLLPDGDSDPLNAFIYRSDNVTAASFVSHKADLHGAQLAAVDLLPKVKDKVLVTKEMADIFAGKREQLIEKFARLTNVLDGQGYTSDTGTHGRRGYTGPISLQWLGATTPLSPEVVSVMAQLGPRILFYDADRQRKSVEALAAYAERGDVEAGRTACRTAVHTFLRTLYDCHPPRTVAENAVTLGPAAARTLALWADVLSRLRADVALGTEEAVAAPPEHAERVVTMLRAFVRGRALAHGRQIVDAEDLRAVAHIACSSGVPGRGRTFSALVTLGGVATSTQLAEVTGFSPPTVQRHMREIAAVGLASFEAGTGPIAALLTLVEPYTGACKTVAEGPVSALAS